MITDVAALPKFLHKVEEVFNIDELLSQDIDKNFVIDYYHDSFIGYRLFHSSKGSVHMALNYDGKFDSSGYREQVKLIDEWVKKEDPLMVLELGSGQGFNSTILARQNKAIQFLGIDITPGHVNAAKKRSWNLRNLKFELQDFNNIQLPDKKADLVFEIESLCHAERMDVALAEVSRVLRQGGLFILFDGFRQPDFPEKSIDLKQASKLAEISMAVENPWIISEWIKLAQKSGFELVEKDDISYAILPNLSRFQFLARGFYKYPSLGKLLVRLLPKNLILNSIAGLLMPITITSGAQGYYKIVLRKT